VSRTAVERHFWRGKGDATADLPAAFVFRARIAASQRLLILAEDAAQTAQLAQWGHPIGPSPLLPAEDAARFRIPAVRVRLNQ
jgi:hypothetical protein